MDSDLGLLLRVQPTLNPWLVVLLGSIAGLLVFAISSALQVRYNRNRSSPSYSSKSLAARTRRMVVAAATTFSLLMLVRAIPGPTLVDARGWLTGDGLFTVEARRGFLASYPDRAREVQQGAVILHLVRDAGPEEIAAATSRRALLVQDLEFARLEAPKVDPLLVTEHTAAEERLRELQSTRYKLEQTVSSLKAATASLGIAKRPELQGFFPGDEVVKRAERVEVLKSRRAELSARIALLAGEKQIAAKGAAVGEDKQGRQQDAELATLQVGIEKAKDRVQLTSQAVEQDKLRAERQHENRVHQIELQIAEIDALLDRAGGSLEVRAPWSGVVGFREPSPASARSGNRPLLVLYRPGTVAAKVHVPADQSVPAVGDAVEIEMQAQMPQAVGTTFGGTITQSRRQPDGSAELLIAGDPPEVAVRELAQGNSVPVQTLIRHTNPLAKLAASWWAALAIVVGIVFAELRHHRARRREAKGKVLAYATNRWLGLDWGGDAGEYLEYIVGVGIVPRRVREESAGIIQPVHEQPHHDEAGDALKSA